jgi:hypothetical protein
MTQIIGVVRDSMGRPFSGKLEVALDDRAIDRTTTPHSLYLPIVAVIDLIDGEINLALLPTNGTTYRFLVYSELVTEVFRDTEGRIWPGPRHEENGFWYTGAEPSEGRESLSRSVFIERREAYPAFHAAIPDREQPINFSDLLPSGVTSSTQDTSFLAIASILLRPEFSHLLPTGRFNLRGEWQSNAIYNYYDAVAFGGNTYLWKSASPGNASPPNPSVWQALVEPVSRTHGKEIVNFSFGDASPREIARLQGAIVGCEIAIVEGVDVDSAIRVGDAENDASLIPDLSGAALRSPAAFVFYPLLVYTEPTQLFLSVYPGQGLTKGKGFIVFHWMQEL